MTTKISHHPSDATLQARASGTLDPARGLIVDMHLSRCPACAERIKLFEAVGGALLEDTAVAQLKPGALERLFRRLAQEVPIAEPTPSSDPLDSYELGKWRWVGPGVHQRSVSVPETDGLKVFMLKARPGTRLPHHKHTGYEWTCVLQGAFEHEFGRFGAGDFDEADETMEHKPVVCEGEPCICIVALQGNIALQSRLGRILQPLIRL